MRETDVDRSPIRGRDAELRVIARCLDLVASGSGAVAVIEGQAGMGKSRLVAEVEALARQRTNRAARSGGSGH